MWHVDEPNADTTLSLHILQRMLSGKYKLERRENRFGHKPLVVDENENVKLLWDFSVQTSNVTE